MRGILIDPFKKDVYETEIADGSNEAIRRAIFPKPEGSQWLEGVQLDAGLVGFIDEEGLLKPWDYQAFFQFIPGQPIAGRMLILSNAPGGEVASARINVAAVRRVIRFIEPPDVRAEALTISYFDSATGKMSEPQPVHGNIREWTYEDQPSTPRKEDV